MFMKSNQGSLPKVQKYNAVIVAQQERRSQCVQDMQPAQEVVAGDGGCRNIEELVRSVNAIKIEGIGGVAILEERCC